MKPDDGLSMICAGSGSRRALGLLASAAARPEMDPASLNHSAVVYRLTFARPSAALSRRVHGMRGAPSGASLSASAREPRSASSRRMHGAWASGAKAMIRMMFGCLKRERICVRAYESVERLA